MASGLVALALLMTVSRGAWVALAFVLVLGGIVLCKPSRRLLVVLTVVVVLFCIGYFVFVDDAHVHNIPVIGPILTGTMFRPDRWTVWRGSSYLLQDMPYTGIGLGKTFPLVYSYYVLLIPHVYLTYSHNLWLEIWLQQAISPLADIEACCVFVTDLEQYRPQRHQPSG